MSDRKVIQQVAFAKKHAGYDKDATLSAYTALMRAEMLVNDAKRNQEWMLKAAGGEPAYGPDICSYYVSRLSRG